MTDTTTPAARWRTSGEGSASRPCRRGYHQHCQGSECECSCHIPGLAAGDDHARGADGPECIYCEHGPWCLTCPPPPVVDGKVCGPCREAITRSEISADPYYSGGSPFGDGA